MKCRWWRHDWAPWKFYWHGFYKWRERTCLTCGKNKCGYWDG